MRYRIFKSFTFLPTLFLASFASASTGSHFDPEVVMAPVMEISLVNENDLSRKEVSRLYACPSEIPADCLVNIVDANALNALVANAEVRPGTYTHVQIGRGSKTGDRYSTRVLGEVKIGTDTYVTTSTVGAPLSKASGAVKGFADLDFNIGAWSYKIPGGLVVTEGDASIELTLVFDIKFTLSAGYVKPGHLQIDQDGCQAAVGADALGLCIGFPQILPVVGTSQVSIHRFDLEILREYPYFDDLNHIIVVFDGQDNPAIGSVMYLGGVQSQVLPLDEGLSKNSNSTYNIDLKTLEGLLKFQNVDKTHQNYSCDTKEWDLGTFPPPTSNVATCTPVL